VSPTHHALLLRLAPVLFVLLWSTGWVVARAGADHADPLTFLCLRFFLAGLVVALIATLAKVRWPKGRHAIHAMISGVFTHAIYLSGVWWTIRHGLPSVVSGLLAAIQPIATALLAPALLGERLNIKQWGGIVLGFVGVALVLEPKLFHVSFEQLEANLILVGINAAGMIAATMGAFYQKRFIQTGDLRTVSVLQYIGALIFLLPAAVWLEPMQIEWTATLVIVMAWSVLAISVGAIGLWLFLIREGEVSRAAALIYLIPPTVAVEAYLLFDEKLDQIQAIGMILTVFGVALTTLRSTASPTSRQD
jgi:drug/metabolite transporter (DMT)-like permease